MTLGNIKHVGILGGGVMGAGIAQLHALAGFEVTIRDVSHERVEATRSDLLDGKWGIKRAVERGKVGFDAGLAAIERCHYTTEVADLREVDLLIEAIPEKLELKREVFAELDALVKDEAIFTSNTSGIVIAEIAEAVSAQRRTRFIGTHYSNPVVVMDICEVIYTPETSQQTIDCIVSVQEKIGRTVAMVKDTPGTRGFIFNRVFGAAFREAMKIVNEGIATREDVDKAMIGGRNWPVGFFGGRGGIGKQW
ncbi:MAG: 3-hydroxyacyl-CoA dehydrogenase family protein [Myxococcales bacterium]|nr:3-hydroxyacyl-CoA dehydrogenase family protein [Myxococcales bacterium]